MSENEQIVISGVTHISARGLERSRVFESRIQRFEHFHHDDRVHLNIVFSHKMEDGLLWFVASLTESLGRADRGRLRALRRG